MFVKCDEILPSFVEQYNVAGIVQERHILRMCYGLPCMVVNPLKVSLLHGYFSIAREKR